MLCAHDYNWQKHFYNSFSDEVFGEENSPRPSLSRGTGSAPQQEQPNIKSAVTMVTSLASSDDVARGGDKVTNLSKYIVCNSEEEDSTNKYKCTICQKSLSGEAPVNDHLKSAKHRKKEVTVSQSPQTEKDTR